ncbi:MAG TPA: hypothetical protein VEU62_07135 [Bryobacterales bacterium]|nr:hypothetical protein [Bryobacterales bacterium]
MSVAWLLLLTALPLPWRPAAQAVPGQAGKGWAALERALQAAGGRDKLAAVRDMSFDLQSRVVTPQGEFDIESKSQVILPGIVRQESRLPFGVVVMAFSSAGGWRKGLQGPEKLSAAELRIAQAELARANILFRPPSDPSAVSWAGEDSVDGRPCDAVEIANVGGGPLRLCVDRASGDVVKRSYRTDASVEEMASDFREVNGLRLSFRLRVIRDGKLARESVTQNLKINAGLKAEDLLRRPK